MHQIQYFDAVPWVLYEELGVLNVERRHLQLDTVAIHVLVHVLLRRDGLANLRGLYLEVQLFDSVVCRPRKLFRDYGFLSVI